MFVATQFIGLYIIHADIFNKVNGSEEKVTNPILSFLQPPEVEEESDFTGYFISIIIAFILAIGILFLLTRFKINIILRGWFFLVVAIALFITINSLFPNYISSIYFIVISSAIALALAFLKLFRRNFFIHNITELLIYPGIATLFVPIIDFWSIIVLLIMISVYDMWAVWHSGVMQKMAKYQINNLKIFSGFLIPHIPQRLKDKIKRMRSRKQKKKVKVNIAILGGGDIVFPMITAGVMLNSAKYGRFPAFLSNLSSPLFNISGLGTALFVIAGATLGLGLLFLFSEKKKFYPAMPFITAGIFLGMILSYLIL